MALSSQLFQPLGKTLPNRQRDSVSASGPLAQCACVGNAINLRACNHQFWCIMVCILQPLKGHPLRPPKGIVSVRTQADRHLRSHNRYFPQRVRLRAKLQVAGGNCAAHSSGFDKYEGIRCEDLLEILVKRFLQEARERFCWSLASHRNLTGVDQDRHAE